MGTIAIFKADFFYPAKVDSTAEELRKKGARLSKHRDVPRTDKVEANGLNVF